MKKIQMSALIALLISSCTVEPTAINYGQDHCQHCDMAVVDKTHAAQYVTKKGKAYVFDAIECLLMKLTIENNESQMAFILVANYGSPGNLIDAKSATYLVSEKIKSPMGGNLSAFESLEAAQVVQTEKGGELFSWEEMKAKYTH